MFINSKKIIKIINEIAPENTAESWDNVGFQIGNENLEVDRIMIALEITKEVVEEAIIKNIDLIITHHPLIFGGVKRITVSDPISDMLIKLIKNDINLYVAHTNYDVSGDGINDYLANLIELKRVKGLKKMVTYLNNEAGYYLGTVGYFDKEYSLADLSELVKEKFNIKNLKVVKSNEKKIKKVAICSGAGSDLIADAKKAGCQCLITGDIKYHEAQLAKQLNINIIDAGHFETEILFIDSLFEYLSGICRDKGYNVKVIKSEEMINPFEIL